MTEVATARRIGEPVFVVQSNGNIVRTAVKSLTKGDYGTFARASGQQFFDFDEALGAAEQAIQAQIDSGDLTRNEENTLREKLSQLRTAEFRESVFGQELIQSSGMMGMVPEKSLGQEVDFPTDYFLPGKTVFGLVTASSHYTMSPGWRPRPYFILKMIIKEVSFADAHVGNLYYRFAKTHYHFPRDYVFGTKEAALQAMMRVFAEQTGGTILPENIEIHTSAEEEAYTTRQLDEMIASRLGNRGEKSG